MKAYSEETYHVAGVHRFENASRYELRAEYLPTVTVFALDCDRRLMYSYVDDNLACGPNVDGEIRGASL